MQSTWNLDSIIILIKETFPENFIKIWLREGTFHNFASQPDTTLDQRFCQNMRNYQKMPSWGWILMKFSGKVSFIIIMILFKFQADCITLNFAKSSYTINASKLPKMIFFPKFFLNCVFWHEMTPKKKTSEQDCKMSPFFHPVPRGTGHFWLILR